MTEAEFWTASEFQISKALGQLSDDLLRFLWCDGLVPDDVQPHKDAIIGRAFIEGDSGRSSEYRFRVSLERDVVENRWEAFLPEHGSHNWLSVDKHQGLIELKLRARA
jgi:hypothetical protein